MRYEWADMSPPGYVYGDSAGASHKLHCELECLVSWLDSHEFLCLMSHASHVICPIFLMNWTFRILTKKNKSTC